MSAEALRRRALRLFDCFPACVQGRQVPARAPRTDHPQPSLRRIERQPAAYRKVLNRLIAAQRAVAEQTCGVHAFNVLTREPDGHEVQANAATLLRRYDRIERCPNGIDERIRAKRTHDTGDRMARDTGDEKPDA